jgi:hypothetical protein
MNTHGKFLYTFISLTLTVLITSSNSICQTIQLNEEGKRLLQELRSQQYEVIRGDGSFYFVSPAELVENYHKIRKEAKHIKKSGVGEEKLAVVYLTPDPSKAEVQQMRDKDSSYIYKLKDFNAKLLNNTSISPIGETKAVDIKTVQDKKVRIIKREVYSTRETKLTTNSGDSYLPWWLPFSPP